MEGDTQIVLGPDGTVLAATGQVPPGLVNVRLEDCQDLSREVREAGKALLQQLRRSGDRVAFQAVALDGERRIVHLVAIVSSDDDMRPYALMEHSLESLEVDEIAAGACTRPGTTTSSTSRSTSSAAFNDVLGKKVAEVPDNYERGEVLVDTAMHLETNATKGLARENSLTLERGPVAADAVVKMAQTFRSGTNDIDAMDFVDMFLDDEDQVDPDGLNDV